MGIVNADAMIPLELVSTARRRDPFPVGAKCERVRLTIWFGEGGKKVASGGVVEVDPVVHRGDTISFRRNGEPVDPGATAFELSFWGDHGAIRVGV